MAIGETLIESDTPHLLWFSHSPFFFVKPKPKKLDSAAQAQRLLANFSHLPFFFVKSMPKSLESAAWAQRFLANFVFQLPFFFVKSMPKSLESAAWAQRLLANFLFLAEPSKRLPSISTARLNTCIGKIDDLLNKLSDALRTGGQGHPAHIHIPTPTPTHSNLQQSVQHAHFSTFRFDHHRRTNGRTNRRTNLLKSCVSATKNH